MSAAEKLRALEKDLTPASWWAEDGELYCDALGDQTPFPLGFAQGNALVADLRNALPQIVAVVEAAEQARDTMGVAFSIKPKTDWARLRDALAALDSALGDVTP